ncbi:ubiquitin carboxyl-terminal hydrolase 32-like, partial [Centruroides sculpturatus]|uniref:ubiquitin carboxyl-terminal hydrolase 32-like n=1 Tax=Centruroides sculpturatus TaxID=218467 RepID=UPI000C6DE6F6
DDSLGYEYPFTLKAVQKDGLLCALCPWYSFCRGCRIECCDADFNFSAAYIAIDWDPTALHLRYQASQELVFMDHRSVEQTRRQQTEPINLHDCLEAFTKEEELGEEEKYYCSKCKLHQLASKKLQIWRLPPILIVHLKRFQLLNGRWVKSHKIVHFPFHQFDPTDYLGSEPKSAVMNWRKQRHNKTLSHSNRDITLITNCNDDIALMQNKDSDNIFQVPLNQNCNQHSINVPSQDKLITSSLNSKKDTNKLLNGSVVFEHPLSEKFENNNLDLGEKCKDQMNIHNIKKQEENFQDYHQHQLQSGYDPLSLKYKLYALACHSGILGGGHYICYACNPNNRWYCYNDSSCKELELDQIDANSAYMLFYEREGLDYESYMPDVSGRLPDMKEIEDEFENDFRKMCSIQ